MEQTRTLINEDPHTLGSFLSPKRHGYKLFVFMQTEYTGVCMTVSGRAR